MISTAIPTRLPRILGLLGLLILPAGCAPREGLTGPDLGPPEPVVMLPDSAEVAAAWYRRWLTEPNLIAGDGVGRMGVISKVVPSPVAGEGRILCRLILYGPDYKPMRSDGPIQAILIARPNTPDEQAMGAWSLTAAEAGDRFRYGRLPGYFLDLLRPRRASSSLYGLLLRWTSADGRHRQTRRITVEDSFRYESAATQPAKPRPLDPRAGAGDGGAGGAVGGR